MKKGVKVNYPKKKPRLNAEELGEVTEPERHSMYQVMLENLKIANRMTFLHRIIYVAYHTFACCDDATSLFEGIIKKCNETYCIEKLSGFFLYYKNYIVHMVEGDEDNINKHLKYLLDNTASHYEYFGTIKLLIHVSNINQRFFENWVTLTGSPPKLLEKLDIHGNLQQCGRHTFNCLKKLYSLMNAYSEDLAAEHATLEVRRPTNLGTIEFGDSGIRAYSFSDSLTTNSLERSNTDPSQKDYKLFLPEYELLDFILESNFTMKLQDYFILYGVVPMRDIYKDRVWPVPHDFIPYDVFEKPFDCIKEFPKDQTKTYSASPGIRITEVPSTKESTTEVSEGNVLIATESVEGDL